MVSASIAQWVRTARRHWYYLYCAHLANMQISQEQLLVMTALQAMVVPTPLLHRHHALLEHSALRSRLPAHLVPLGIIVVFQPNIAWRARLGSIVRIQLKTPFLVTMVPIVHMLL